MKVVFDTNVLIAAFIARGACSDVFEHCARRHEIVISDFILNELRQHLVEKFNFSSEEAEEVTRLVSERATVVMPVALGDSICRDPDDDVILGTAIAAGADCILTGDADLLVIGRFQAVDIVRPADFAQYEATRAK